MKQYGVLPTPKQLEFIIDIENKCGPPWFRGKTKVEASAYIGSRMNDYNLQREQDGSRWKYAGDYDMDFDDMEHFGIGNSFFDN